MQAERYIKTEGVIQKLNGSLISEEDLVEIVDKFCDNLKKNGFIFGGFNKLISEKDFNK